MQEPETVAHIHSQGQEEVNMCVLSIQLASYSHIQPRTPNQGITTGFSTHTSVAKKNNLEAYLFKNKCLSHKCWLISQLVHNLYDNLFTLLYAFHVALLPLLRFMQLISSE